MHGYLTFLVALFAFLWPALAPPGALGQPAQQHESSSADAASAEDLPSVQARPADAFVESTGVNVHFGYRDMKYHSAFDELVPLLDTLGIRHVRDAPWGVDGWKEPRARTLYEETGIRLTALLSQRVDGYPTPLDLSPERMRSTLDYIEETYGAAISALEGPNEYDVSHGSDEDWAARLRQYQELLYKEARSRKGLAGVPILAPSFTQKAAVEEAGDLSAWADWSNIHPYPGGQQPAHALDYNLETMTAMAPGHPVAATETGYHNATGNATDGDGHIGQPGVPEAVHAKYVPRMYMEYFRRGIERTFLYELLDSRDDPDRDHQEENFGLLRNDLSKKPAFRALQRTIALLEDPAGGSAFPTGALRYELTGDTTGVREVLLQKEDGRFYLALWQEVSGYRIPDDYKSGAPGDTLSPAPAQVTLRLAEGYEAAVYEPLRGAAPQATYAKAQTLSLRVPDHLMIVELRPPTPGAEADQAGAND